LCRLQRKSVTLVGIVLPPSFEQFRLPYRDPTLQSELNVEALLPSALPMNYSRGKPRGIQQPKEKAYAASREESDPTRLKERVQSSCCRNQKGGDRHTPRRELATRSGKKRKGQA
jgi:hypothetical protein